LEDQVSQFVRGSKAIAIQMIDKNPETIRETITQLTEPELEKRRIGLRMSREVEKTVEATGVEWKDLKAPVYDLE
jgi:Fe-S cluster assembly scaffold protein SufB